MDVVVVLLGDSIAEEIAIIVIIIPECIVEAVVVEIKSKSLESLRSNIR